MCGFSPIPYLVHMRLRAGDDIYGYDSVLLSTTVVRRARMAPDIPVTKPVRIN